jgi:two-component sensor histidine kinase
MLPALLMGVVTNLYITAVIYYVGGDWVHLSPAIGSLIFLACYFPYKMGHMSNEWSFFIGSIVVIGEVYIHTRYLGWDCGFFYYIYLLPMIILLNPKWSYWISILYSLGAFGVVAYLWKGQYTEVNYYNIPDTTKSILKFINLSATGSIIIVLMLYFSRTIHKKDEKLKAMNLELEHQNKELDAQHSHKEILLKEVHHRVKNNLQIISSLISLQRISINNKEVEQVLDESKRRIEAIALIHQKLYQDENVAHVNFKSYLQTIIDLQKELNPNVECSLESNDVMLYLDIAVPLGLVTSELISNAFKHGFSEAKSPKLTINLTDNKENKYLLKIEDNGVGLPPDFSIDKNSSLGMEIIDALTEQIDAKVNYYNDPGAIFEISFQNKLSETK